MREAVEREYPKESAPDAEVPKVSVWVRDLTEEGIEPNPGPRICSKNIDGISTADHFSDAIKCVKREHERDPILAVLLQEHHVTQTRLSELRLEAEARKLGLLYLQAHRPVAEAKGGAAIMIPLDSIELKAKEDTETAIKRVIASTKRDPGGGWITADTLLDGKLVTLASAYAPPDSRATERPAFFNKLADELNDHSILGTDANCVPDPSVDLQRNAASAYQNDGARELFNAITSHDLTDVTRKTLGDSTPFFTNHTMIDSRHGVIAKTRIDQIYTPALDAVIWTLDQGTDFLKRGRTYGHDMLQARAKIVRPERGRDLRSISEAIFDDPAFNGELAELIKSTIAEADPSSNGWGPAWEAVKVAARDECLEQTKRQREKRNDEARKIAAKIEILDAQIRAGAASATDYTHRDELKKQLRDETTRYRSLHDMLEKDAYEQGQKHDVSSAAFYRQWTPRNSDQWVEELIRRDWSDPSNPQPDPSQADKENDHKRVAEAFTEYYKPLFADKPVDQAAKEEALRTLRKGRRVLKPTAAECDADIHKDEVLHTCAYLPIGKSPGPDRLPNKFYRVFSKVIAPILTHVFNESRQPGKSLPKTLHEGIISVLYKKKERDDPRNYRPITLLNNDYKIMMRILTARMNKAVVQFVSRDQNGFVPDAFIAENIMRLKLLQDMIEEENFDALFIYLDMEKAFDRCSWEFLVEGLRAIGFGQGFVDFVELAYSHGDPPTRQLYVNGFLGPSFPLGSGVAQGCPLSPLLFLIIAEPLTRLINNNRSIWGVETHSRGRTTRHKVSQFADDSTLILRLADVGPALKALGTWCKATSMKENASKREIQLLGPLRGRPELLPPELQGNAIVKDGDSIRALGVPMGNAFDEEQWWLTRYKEVKRRVSKWNGLAKLSLTGRNMLLQSILYGSMRYWFFTLIVPDSIVDIIELDAKALLWASNPELHTDEVGTAQRSKRYIHHQASHIAQKSGGGGIMHLKSHIKAFQAQWIVKYLDPRDSPWKDVLDHWILRKDSGRQGQTTPLGRGVILTPGELARRAKRLPEASAYMRACFAAFAELDVRQDLSLITHATAGEPLWHNNRFTIKGADESAFTEHLLTYRLSDLFDSNGFYTRDNWAHWFEEHAPFDSDDEEDEKDEWITARELDLPNIRPAIPREVRDAISSQPEPIKEGEIVHARDERNGAEIFAKHHTTADGTDVLLELFLDTSRYPHETGRQIRHRRSITITRAALWTAMNKHYVRPYAGDEDDTPEERSSVVGPITCAFPLNDGWSTQEQKRRRPSDRSRRLSDLTIEVMTAIFTKRIVGSTRPSCEAAWQSRIHRPLAPVWPVLWQSLGTPLSDPTEEKNYRRLLHRAIDARNRHPGANHTCRLLCGCADESMCCTWSCAHEWRSCGQPAFASVWMC